MLFKGDTISIFDKNSKSIYLFNEDGKFLSKIERIGRSRAEYIDILDMTFSKDEIIILDNSQFKVLAFDYQGKYKYSFEIEEGVSINSFGNNIFIGNYWGGAANVGWRILNYDKNGELVSKHIQGYKKDYKRLISENSFFTKYNDSLYYWQPTDDIVYKYYDGEFIPSYKFDLKEKMLPEKYARRGLDYVMSYCKNSAWLTKLSETPRFIFAVFSVGSNSRYPFYTLIYDKNKNEMSCLSFFLHFEHLSIRAVNAIIDENGEYIVIYYPGNTATSYYKKDYESKKGKSLWSKSILNLKETDNGVLIKMKLKK